MLKYTYDYIWYQARLNEDCHLMTSLPMARFLALVDEVPCVWTYRDRSLEKDWRFPFKLSNIGPDKSKRSVG